jgi:hypothetical protein
MEFVKSLISQVNQKSTNTQIKELTSGLDTTTLNTAINPKR